MTGLVIFDNDGVLVDSERLANTILAELLTEAGLPYTFEEAVRDFMGGSMASMRQKAEAQLGRPLPADLEDRYHQRLFDGFAHLQAIAGVEAVLDHLDARGVTYCLASSGTHRRIRTALTAVGFPGSVRGPDLQRGGRCPRQARARSVPARGESMGVKPADCVVVEDSPLGVAAANAAGMKVFGYAGMTDPAKLSAADAVFHDMAALAELIDGA